jgi:hypothetical protein
MHQHLIALFLDLVSLRDVLVNGDPARSLHRLPHDANHPPVSKLFDLTRNFVGWLARGLGWVVLPTGVFLGKDVVGGPMGNDRLMRCSDFHQLGRQAIQIGVALIADNEAFLRIEHAQTVGHVVERRGESQIRLLE